MGEEPTPLKRSYLRLRSWFLISAISLVMGAASLWLYGLVLQREAAGLLTDVTTLKVGNTSSEDAKRVTEHHRKELSKAECTGESCEYGFTVSNRLLSWTHAEPPAKFIAGFTVVDGTVTHIYADLARFMPIYPTFSASAGEVDEYAETPEYFARAGHYGFPTPVGKPYLRVILDRQADVTQRQHAFAFSFQCLTKLGGGCDLPCDYLPKAFADWQTEIERSGFPMSDFETAYPGSSRCKRF